LAAGSRRGRQNAGPGSESWFMHDLTTERIIELQKQLRIRMAEIGFGGVQASNVVHHLGEIAGLAHDLAAESVPLFLELSPAHREALAEVVVHLKCDLDEIKDGIQDMEPDFTELLKFLQQK
jgi:hypothetical protein